MLRIKVALIKNSFNLRMLSDKFGNFVIGSLGYVWSIVEYWPSYYRKYRFIIMCLSSIPYFSKIIFFVLFPLAWMISTHSSIQSMILFAQMNAHFGKVNLPFARHSIVRQLLCGEINNAQKIKRYCYCSNSNSCRAK